MRRILALVLVLGISVRATAQLRPVYVFQKDDSVVKHNYYLHALQKNEELINSLGKEHKDDYKSIYENRFKEISDILLTSRSVTDPEADHYLQSLVQKIINANDELKGIDVRVLFSRDYWPNAYSLGEGTLMVNAGLMIFLANESELVFVLCHELAHYYLDHGNKAIKKQVETINSEELKKELKRLSKMEYRFGEEYEKLMKKLVFDIRQHSRESEAEADRYGFRFIKNTGFDTHAIITCLQKLDRIDDSSLFQPLQLEQVFNFPDYPFKKKWIQKTSVLFGDLKDDDSPLTQKEKDSLKTHPDCMRRIALLNDSVSRTGPGSQFEVDESLFNQLKKDFFVEMTEENYREKDLGRNLYYCLLMLQQGDNRPVAIYSIARGLNLAYEARKEHSMGTLFVAESRGLPADYNLLLRMLSRLQLDEIAALAFNFCKKYAAEMSGYAIFGDEMYRAAEHMN